MKHYGDIKKISGYSVEAVDVIIGGSPCQDLSLAGKRAGLNGERSGLFMEQMRIVKEMRDDDRTNGQSGEFIRPRYMVWENVPGALSSNNGKDFQTVLTEIVKIAEPNAPDVPLPEHGKWPLADAYFGNGWSIAYRVHDAQYWGVPQRRRRIALVADFGGWTAPYILFDPQYWRETTDADSDKVEGCFGTESRPEIQSIRKSVSGDFEPGETAREEITGAAGISVEESGDIVIYSFDSLASNSMKSKNPNSGCREVEIAKTLDCFDPNPSKNQGEIAIIQGALNPWDSQSARVYSADGVWHSLNANENGGQSRDSVFCFSKGTRPHSKEEAQKWERSECANTLNGFDIGEQRSSELILQSRDSVFCLQGNCIDRADTAGCNEKGWTENVSYTLNTIDRPAVCAGFSMGQSEKARSIGYQEEISPTLRGGEGGNQKPCVLSVAQNQVGEVRTSTVSGTLNTNSNATGRNSPLVYDARGNGDEKTVCTLTGDHQDSATDYTALCVGNGQLNQISMAEQANTLDTMHDQQAIMCTAVDCRNGTENTKIRKDSCDDTEPRNQILRILQETYGEKAVFQWGIRVLEFLQSEEILRQRMYESSISSKAENGNELGGSTLPSPEIVARWLLRDMREQQECGCSPQGRKSAEQSDGKFAEALPELPSESAQAAKFMLDLWKAGKRLGLLQQALYQIQKVWKSANVQRAVVRRLTPLEAERLQGLPDGWTDIGDWTDSKGKKHKTSDSARYRAIGNGIALPFWRWLLERISAQYDRPATMASLFDGIGSFPLIWQEINGEGSVLWNSEVDEFCEAVTKKRIG